MLRWLVLALVTFASQVQAQPRLGDELVADPGVWRAFKPLVIAAGDGDRERAIAYLRAGNRLLRKVETKLERDAPTQAFEDAARASYQGLDLRELMALLPEQDGAYRRFAFMGQETESAYRLSAPRGDFEVHEGSTRRGFGDASSIWRMRHLEGADDKRYLAQWRGGVGVGNVQWASIVRGASDVLRMIEENAVLPAEDQRPMLLRTADAFLKKTQPALASEDRRVLALAFASFPEVAKLLTSIGSTDDVIDLSRTRGGLTRLRLVSHFDLARMATRYPELAHYLRGLGDLVDLEITLRDAHGNTLASVWLDSGRMLSRVEAYVRDGALVPSRAGKPLPEVAPAYEHMEAHVDIHGHAVGIHMYVDDLRIEMDYRDGALATRVRHTPGFRVEGRAFGVFPAGMLDWFIPGDIPGLARRMFDVATKGNEGKGIVVDYRFAGERGATVDFAAGVEVLDTALIRFGMAIAADRVIPDDDESADIRKLWVGYRGALSKDLERFARYGAVP